MTVTIIRRLRNCISGAGRAHPIFARSVKSARAVEEGNVWTIVTVFGGLEVVPVVLDKCFP